MANLKYFQTISTDDLKKTAEQLEEVLQQEHQPDGTHPLASESRAGFISAKDYQALQNIIRWFNKNY